MHSTSVNPYTRSGCTPTLLVLVHVCSRVCVCWESKQHGAVFKTSSPPPRAHTCYPTTAVAPQQKPPFSRPAAAPNTSNTQKSIRLHCPPAVYVSVCAFKFVWPHKVWAQVFWRYYNNIFYAVAEAKSNASTRNRVPMRAKCIIYVPDRER